jgi:hypothetical protein
MMGIEKFVEIGAGGDQVDDREGRLLSKAVSTGDLHGGLGYGVKFLMFEGGGS